MKFDDEKEADRKARKVTSYSEDRCCRTSHCTGDEHPLEVGQQTLFVNAAIQGDEEHPIQLPWLVDIELAPCPADSIDVLPDLESPPANPKRKSTAEAGSVDGQTPAKRTKLD